MQKTWSQIAVMLSVGMLLAAGLACAGGAAPATPTSLALTSAPAPTSGPLATALVATDTPPAAATATAPGATGAGAKVPGSCNDIVSLVDPYVGGVATTQSLGSPQHLSCEFANAKASTIIIVNIGVGGTAATFDTLRATSAQGGRTVTPVSGLGASAFSVSKNNVPAGVAVLTAQGLIYVVNSNLPIAQDEALIKQLMALS